MVEDPLTHLKVHHMAYHLNKKLYVGQDLLGLLLKKQSTFSCFISAVNGCVSISASVSLVGALEDITSSPLGIKICTINSGIKKYKSIIKKSKEKYDEIVLVAKTKLDTIKVLISTALIHSYINDDNSFQ